MLAGTTAWAWVLLGRSAEFLPWLRWVIVGATLVTCAAVLLRGGARRFTAAIALAAMLTGLAAPAAYAAQTAATAHTGSIPLAGPSTGSSPFGDRGGAVQGGPGAAETADPALVALLQSAGTKWSAATLSAMGGASLALASDTTVMSIGGFTGSDPAPTLDQFKAYVAAGEVRYFVEGGGGPGGRMAGGTPAAGSPAGADQVGAGNRGPGGRSSEIGTWVQQTFSPTTVGGRTVYDLTQPRG